jgi:hypothetical protein
MQSRKERRGKTLRILRNDSKMTFNLCVFASSRLCVNKQIKIALPLFLVIWLSTLLKLGSDWFVTFFRCRQTWTTTRQNQNRPHAEARRAQRKTAQEKVLSFISCSALSASQESKANGRESGRLLFLFHVFRCFAVTK